MSTSDSEPHSLTGDASHLSSTFKRPFDQLDVGENIEGETPSSSAAGNDRHKRARSESRSEVTSGSGAVPSNVGGIDPDHLSATLEQLAALPGPSRIDRSSNAQRGDEFPNQYELSMERFNNFEEQIQPLREASPILERRSPSSSENPHDEDEIMEQLFAEPARSSQSWRADHAPPPIITEPPYVSYAPPYPPHTEDVIDIIGRRNSEPSERDVVVISDSDDEVEIVDRSNQAHSTIAQDSVSVSDVPSVDPLDLWDGLTTVFNPWADSLAGQTSTPVAHTSPSPTTSSRNRSQPSPSGSSAERRARLPSIHETGRSLRPSPAWSPSPSSRTPAASTSLAVEEQGMARLRGLAELRRRMDEERLESLQRGADVRAVLRRIRDASDRARPPLRFGAAQSNTHDDSLRPVPSTPFVYEGEGTRIDNPFPRSSLSASTGRLGSARTATDTADSRLNELFSSVGRLATPVVTSQTAGRSSQGSENTSVESDQRRHSLVMEGLLNSNPALVSGWRPVPRRAAQPEGSQPSPSSTSQSTTSQNTYYNSRPAVSRSSPSRPPSWLTSTSPSASSDPRNQAIPPSSTDDSIASFVTADTSFEDNISVEQAASTAAAHAPAVSSPLREVYIVPSPTPPSQDPLTQSSVLRDDASVDGVNMRDITSRVQSLSGLLMNMATSTHASAAVRDAALRVITSGQALVRAIDSDGRYNDGQMGNDTSTITVDIGDGNIQSFATRDHQARSSSSATINSTSQIPQQSSSFESWTPHDRSGIEDIISRPLHDPPRNDIVRNSLPPSSLSSSEGSGNRGYHVAPPLIDPARSSRLDTGVDNDRWTQARHHRRRLQNDLLAEESRMRSLRRLSETYAPELSRRSRRPEVDSSRMDVDSEDEVEVLFNSGAFDGQDSMECE
ncbi:hypothetical protein BDY19DRAFT_1060194 [Irpex rosettiformis]|uniref:Uncharacterized protein n=1 Tax=Irpex rosettiformis TaxID=378272 RepID=A0ACB8TS13_9APHY|nr:hypothetical protein BDY19DRAFT_1060194 [Irpex rosettiformis]